MTNDHGDVYLIESALSKELAPKGGLATLNDRPTIRVRAWIAELASSI